MFFMISYDIVDDTRRRIIQKILEGYGERVQYSVFECDLTESQYRRLRGEISRHIDEEEDSVRFYPLCRECVKVIEWLGNVCIKEDEHFFIC